MVEEPSDNPYIRDPDLDFKDISTLSEESAKEQVEQLREAVEYHDYRYYVENDPIISDNAYDQLFDRLQTLEDEFDLHSETSPTQRVGGETLDELETREHVQEMLSLASSGDEEEVRDFASTVNDEVGDVEYSVEPKFDGFSVEIVYLNGSFDRAVTRGDGIEGEDVSENVKTIPTVPLELQNAPDFLAVRGEIYMPESGFQDLNKQRVQEGKDPFANPRNAAAGTVRLLNPDKVANRPLNIYFYDILQTSATIESQRDIFDLLDHLGIRINQYNQFVDDIDSFIEYRENMLEKRDELEYEIDGVVAKVNEFEKRDEMGQTARHPRWAFAYKFPAQTGETTIEQIVVQVGRTGKLTPVALLQPVDIKGVTISRATLHNESQAQQLGVGEGARVSIERAGDVIPEVAEVLESGEDVFEMPETCPVCDSQVVQEGEYHYCTGGMSCKAQLKRSVQHFASQGAMDIEGIGEKVADELVEKGFIDSIADIYTLDVDDLSDLEGWGEQSASNLVEEIEASKSPTLTEFIFGLGIRHIGKERARLLAEDFTLDELRNADIEDLQSVEDIGPEAAKSITDFFANERNQREIDRLLDAGISPQRVSRTEELQGLKLVITGSVAGFTREELIELLERKGGDVTSSVSDETDYLLVGDNPGQRKQEQADEHNIPTVDAVEFLEENLEEDVLEA